MLSKKYEIWQPFLLSVAVIIGMIVGVKFSDKNLGTMIEKVPGTSESGNGRVEDIIRFIENKYVDQLESDSLVEIAILSVMRSLDPHSVYISPEQLVHINEQMQGSFEGLGLETLVVDSSLYVLMLTEDGPAEKAGLRKYDRLIAVDQHPLDPDSLYFPYISKYLSGHKGDTLQVLVERNTTTKTFQIHIDQVAIPSVDLAYEISPGIAYIKLKRFSANTYREFMQALEPMLDQGGIKDLIIDLRDNPGGYLPETTKILSQLFRERDKLLVYTEGKNSKLTEYKSTGQNFFDIQDIAVLINENSASGSEIIAGAIQDWDRGLVIGRRSFGKGLVQEQFHLSNGGAIRLTTARYYTPIGRSIQRPYGDREAYQNDLNKRIYNGELFNGQSYLNPDTQVYLSKIYQRKLFGGGGITPDVVLATDSMRYLTLFQEIQQAIQVFVFRILSENSLDIQLEEDEFISEYKIPGELMKSFLSTQEMEEYRSFVMANEALKTLVRQELKVAMARQLFSQATSLKVLNKYDPDVRKAIHLVSLEEMMKNYPIQ